MMKKLCVDWALFGLGMYAITNTDSFFVFTLGFVSLVYLFIVKDS